MLLLPRKFKFKNIHKRRFFRFPITTKLVFGQIGLLLTQPLRLEAKHLFRYKLFLKKSSKRTDKTLRKFWLNLFPHIPITRKIPGSRMGKGKGKLEGWSSEVPAGLHIIEMKNLRYGRAVYFLKQVMNKLAAKSVISQKSTKLLPLTLRNTIYVKYDVIW